jgi:phosphonate transport system ATP-binding protein
MLMQRPQLILADEPDASLDPRTGEEIMGLLHGLARSKGLAIVVVSHRLEHAMTYADRIVGIAGGRVALDRPARAADAAQLRDFFDEAAT